jgi:hypothetical protein
LFLLDSRIAARGNLLQDPADEHGILFSGAARGGLKPQLDALPVAAQERLLLKIPKENPP